MIQPGDALKEKLKEIGEELSYCDAPPSKEHIDKVAAAFLADLCRDDTACATEYLLEGDTNNLFFFCLGEVIKATQKGMSEKALQKAKVFFCDISISTAVEAIARENHDELEELLIEAANDANQRYRDEIASRKYAGRETEEIAA